MVTSGVLSAAERRVEIAAQNIANASTPGYRRRVSFSQILAASDPAAGPATPNLSEKTDFTPGKQSVTGSAYDLAIGGDGFFVVQSSDQSLYTRDGQFRRDKDQRLVTAQGMPVQSAGGGDITLKSDNFRVLPDGSILEDEQPVGKLAIVDFSDRNLATVFDGGLFNTAATNVKEVTQPVVRQGALETSNVSLGDEMISIMASLRGAESSQRLVNLYDELLGRAFTSLGQN